MMRTVAVFTVIAGVFVILFDRRQLSCVQTQTENVKSTKSVINKDESPSMSILCFLMVTPDNIKLARARRDKWGRRVCGTFLLFAGNNTVFTENSTDVTRLPLEIDQNRQILSHKAFLAFQHIATNYPHVDWVIKSDPDTYVIADNLLQYLHRFSSVEPHYLGREFKLNGNVGDAYVAGALVAVSRATMAQLKVAMSNGDSADKAVSLDDLTNRAAVLDRCSKAGWNRSTHADDLALGRCLRELGIFPQNTRDSMNRERFLVFNVAYMARNDPIDPDFWYTQYSFGVKASPEAVCFHYETSLEDNDRDLIFENNVWKWAAEP